MSDVTAKLRAELDALPHNADGIATVVARAGIRGTPKFPCGCPLALYLAQKLGIEVMVAPSADGKVKWLAWARETGGSWADCDGVPLPPAAALFARRVDEGFYEQLCRAWHAPKVEAKADV